MSHEKKIRLLIVDDHPVAREGLQAMLSRRNELTVIATASDGYDAVRQYRLCKPDITLMDLRMPRMDGVDALREIRKIDPTARVIIFTTYEDDEDVFRAVEAGASAYLLKDARREELLECIHCVYDRRTIVSSTIGAKLASHISRPSLTSRELEVLRLMVEGQTNKEIGTALGITEGTVKIHVYHAMQKLAAKSRTGAVRLAVERGLVRLQ